MWLGYNAHMLRAKITAEGRITLPKQVRDLLDLLPGDRLKVEIGPGQVMLTPVRLQAVAKDDKRTSPD
jgi:AbrB family looped-hinge helix DNA binding protein